MKPLRLVTVMVLVPLDPWTRLREAGAAETEKSMQFAQMMVGQLEGRFLEMLVFMTGARRVLEIGMFTGYSALSMARALPPDGHIVTCDIDLEESQRTVAYEGRFHGNHRRERNPSAYSALLEA